MSVEWDVDASVRRGLAQAEAGQIEDMGSFAQYADEPEPLYPNDLDGCAGTMFAILLTFIVGAFVVIACLSAR